MASNNAMGEVQCQAGNVLGGQKSFRINVLINDLRKTKEISQKMPKNIRSSFERTHGPILDLLHIPIEDSLLSALAQFWNPNLRCFALPGFDMVPTIEEYESIMRSCIQQNTGPYLYQGSYVKASKVAELIGLKNKKVDFEPRGSVLGWKKDLLEEHLETMARQEDWEHFSRTLALLIYGLVLFPFSLATIDQAAADVFYQFEKQGRSIIPALLSETIITLNVCLGNKKGTLRCCSHMLYVWVVTHLFAASHMGLAPDPLKSFYRIPVKKQSASEWKSYLASLTEGDLRWVCPWYQPRDTIFGCGIFPNVPLMGPRGIITYTPAIAARQLKWTQDMPNIEELGGPSCQYAEQDDSKLRERVKAAWRNIKKKNKKELGEPRVTSTLRYKEWRASRLLPQVTPKEAPQEEESALSKENLISLLHVTRAQLISMENKEEAARVKIAVLEHQCEKAKNHLERLKDEMADINPLKRRKEAPTESQAIQKKYEISQERLAEVLEENEQLKGKAQDKEQLAEVLKEQLAYKTQQAEELCIRVRNLEIETERSATQLAKRDAQLVERDAQLDEKDGLIATWKGKFELERAAKSASMKECDDMNRYIHHHGVNILRFLDHARDAMDANRGVTPLPVYTFVRYCERLIDQLGVQGIDEGEPMQ